MSTFAAPSATVTFDTDGDKYDERHEARVAILEIPGGNNFYADLAGKKPATWSVGMVLQNGTVWGQLNATLGQEGTLNIDTLDSHNAILMSVSRPAPQPNGQTRCTADFLITDT
jgi:hypothetical protein